MAKTREIKEEMQFNSGLKDLLDVMKNIAVFQFRALQRKKERFDKFAQLLGGFFRLVDMSSLPHNLMSPRTEKSVIIMITSNEGFMGALNFQVIDSAILSRYAKSAEFVMVGEVGARYLKDMGKTFMAFKGAADAAARYALAQELKTFIINGVAQERFGRVLVSYPKPVAFMIQTIEVLEIVPLSAFFLKKRNNDEVPLSVIVESPMEGIIGYLAEQFILQKLMEILEDSKLAEFAARAIHLEKSGQELTDKEKQLKGQYFRAYHEFVDKNTRELFSTKIIMNKK